MVVVVCDGSRSSRLHWVMGIRSGLLVVNVGHKKCAGVGLRLEWCLMSHAF